MEILERSKIWYISNLADATLQTTAQLRKNSEEVVKLLVAELVVAGGVVSYG